METRAEALSSFCLTFAFFVLPSSQGWRITFWGINTFQGVVHAVRHRWRHQWHQCIFFYSVPFKQRVIVALLSSIAADGYQWIPEDFWSLEPSVSFFFHDVKAKQSDAQQPAKDQEGRPNGVHGEEGEEGEGDGVHVELLVDHDGAIPEEVGEGPYGPFGHSRDRRRG